MGQLHQEQWMPAAAGVQLGGAGRSDDVRGRGLIQRTQRHGAFGRRRRALLRPVRDNHEQGQIRQPLRNPPQPRQSRAVQPMPVVHDKGHRPALREPRQQHVQRREQERVSISGRLAQDRQRSPTIHYGGMLRVGLIHAHQRRQQGGRAVQQPSHGRRVEPAQADRDRVQHRLQRQSNTQLSQANDSIQLRIALWYFEHGIYYILSSFLVSFNRGFSKKNFQWIKNGIKR